MQKKNKLDPGSYAVIRKPGQPTTITCEILGYRRGMMLVRSPDGTEFALNPSSVQVVDVRNPDEYESGHVANSINIPVNDVLSRFSELPTEKTLLFICQMGGRSGLACEMVAAMGVDPDLIYNIEDGTPSWIENGLPTSYGTDE